MDLNLFLVVAGTICNLAMAVFSVTNKKTDKTKGKTNKKYDLKL